MKNCRVILMMRFNKNIFDLLSCWCGPTADSRGLSTGLVDCRRSLQPVSRSAANR